MYVDRRVARIDARCSAQAGHVRTEILAGKRRAPDGVIVASAAAWIFRHPRPDLTTERDRNKSQSSTSWGRWLLPLGWCALIVACGGGDGGLPDLVAVELTPASVLLAPGGLQQFVAVGRMSDGTTQAVALQWEATGGTISVAGAYTAGTTDGTFRAIATDPASGFADTSSITIVTPPPDLIAVELTPPTAALAPGDTRQFAAVGRFSNGSSEVIPIAWTATGGTVSPAGLYTAGAVDGAWRVIAASAAGDLADTASITITTPPPALVAIEIAPDSTRLSYTGTQQFTATGRLSNGQSTAISVNWSTTVSPLTPGSPNTVDASGLFRAGYPIGRYMVTATEVGGAGLSASVPAIVHSTTGQSVQGPTFWDPTPGMVHLCTSNHFTDDGTGRGGTATTVSSGGGVTQPTVDFTNDGTPFLYGDGAGAVRVVCQPVWSAPAGLVGQVMVTISVASTRPGSGTAKVFTYTVPCPVGDCRAGFTHQQSFEPNWTTAPVSESVMVSTTEGANIWFKSTYVP